MRAWRPEITCWPVQASIGKRWQGKPSPYSLQDRDGRYRRCLVPLGPQRRYDRYWDIGRPMLHGRWSRPPETVYTGSRLLDLLREWDEGEARRAIFRLLDGRLPVSPVHAVEWAEEHARVINFSAHQLADLTRAVRQAYPRKR